MSAERVRSYLAENGVAYDTHTHPAAYTTSEVAQAEDVPGREMAKVVMLIADEALAMAVLPGDRMVDLDKAAEAFNAGEVRLADESEFSPSFPDCERGAEPPFGSLYGVPTLVDLSLDSPRITFNAGSHTETISMDLEDYLTLTTPDRADLVIGTAD